MEKLSPAGHKRAAGPKATTPLTDLGHVVSVRVDVDSGHADLGHADSGHRDSGHTEMAIQTPYHSDQCVQQMLCRLTGTYEPHVPKVMATRAPIAPECDVKGEKPH